MELDAGERPSPVPEQKCLLDTANILERRNVRAIFTRDLIPALRELPDGGFYRKADDRYLTSELLPKALGDSAVVSGTVLFGDQAGQAGKAKGWKALPVLNAAIELHDTLYPPLEAMTDEVDEELAFTPA
jgi:hypothetical protein